MRRVGMLSAQQPAIEALTMSPSPQAEPLALTAADGQTLAASWFGTTSAPATAVLAIAAAMGVPRQFYARFAAHLAQHGIATLTFDYRGTGGSRPTMQRGRDVSLLDWGRQDLEAALTTASRRLPSRPVFLLGHSLGGQIIGLAPASESLAGAVYVAASLPHWRYWPAPGRYALAALWYVVVPTLSAARDTFPARRLRFSSVDVPSGVTRDWAHWARHRRYLFSPELGIDVARYRDLSLPVRAYVPLDDGYCPAAAAAALLDELPLAELECVRIDPAELGLGPVGHFGFFREKMRDTLWAEVLAWLHERAAAHGAATTS
jgi:predicted alpha/beta hydrolase